MASDQSTTPRDEKQWRQVLRAFHLTGNKTFNESELSREQQLWPAVASKLVDDHKLSEHYPLILPSPTDAMEETKPASLLEALKNPACEEGNDRVNSQQDSELEQIVCKVATIPAEFPSEGITQIVANAVPEVSGENEAAGSAPDVQDRLSRLPASGRLVGFGPETLPLLYCWAMAAQLAEPETRFHAEIAELIGGLKSELLHGKQEQDPESLAKTMGEEATLFVDLEKLSRNLPADDAFENQAEIRLELIRETLEVLETFLSSEFRPGPLYLISSTDKPEFPELPAEAKVITPDCFESALGFIDELLERMSRVFRAARIARLLVSGRYQPEVHDEVFSRFEWQSLNQEEILLVPKVLVMESAADIKRTGKLASLSRLFRSGRPVQLLITLDESDLAAEELSGALEDLGPIAMAHREAFVLQSTLACPEQLLNGLRVMANTARPAVGFVSIRSTSQCERAWASEILALYGRIAPCFHYSPDRGPSWSDRLDTVGNPQPDAGPPVINLACSALPATAEKIDEWVTFAHAAALRTEFRDHFCVIPDIAWSDDQQPIGPYLDEFQSMPPASLPYIWVVSEGELCRAIITREMANACRDRCAAWRSLQELAGIKSTLVSATSEEVQPESETSHQSELENALAKGREEGTVFTVNRIVEALLGPKAPITAADSPPTTEEATADER